MSSADEIHKRVWQAEEARIKERADLVAHVAEQQAAHVEAERRIAEIAHERAKAVTAAEKRMDRKELAGFLGVKPSELGEWASAGTGRASRRRVGSRQRSRAGAQTATVEDGMPSSDSVGAGVSGVDVADGGTGSDEAAAWGLAAVASDDAGASKDGSVTSSLRSE